MTTVHSKISKVFDFFWGGGKLEGLEKNPYGIGAPLLMVFPGNRTRALVVRGERFTHKPPMVDAALKEYPCFSVVCLIVCFLLLLFLLCARCIFLFIFLKYAPFHGYTR